MYTENPGYDQVKYILFQIVIRQRILTESSMWFSDVSSTNYCMPRNKKNVFENIFEKNK